MVRRSGHVHRRRGTLLGFEGRGPSKANRHHSSGHGTQELVSSFLQPHCTAFNAVRNIDTSRIVARQQTGNGRGGAAQKRAEQARRLVAQPRQVGKRVLRHSPAGGRRSRRGTVVN